MGDDRRSETGPERRVIDAGGAGLLVGAVDGAVLRLRGVRYAVAERFGPPVAPPPAAEPDGSPSRVLALDRGPACPQSPSRVLTSLFAGAMAGVRYAEQCQTLSLTAPVDATPGDRLPVLVWVHGGSYATGAGDLEIYDPGALVAEQRVVVVQVTYRLGLLGFAGAGTGLPANLGLLDLIAALRWVREHVDAVGGAPDNVTLVGQSSGADAVAHLMVSDGVGGLFGRVILQSPPFGARKRGRAREARRSWGPQTDSLPLEEILRRQRARQGVLHRAVTWGSMPFGCRAGHAPLPPVGHENVAWRDAASRVDVLLGSTTHETGLHLAVLPVVGQVLRVPVLRSLVRALVVRPTTWLVCTRPLHRFAERYRAAGGSAVVYELDVPSDHGPLADVHMAEVPLLLGTPTAWERTAFAGARHRPGSEERGRAMRAIWAAFARTGEVPDDPPTGTIRLR